MGAHPKKPPSPELFVTPEPTKVEEVQSIDSDLFVTGEMRRLRMSRTEADTVDGGSVRSRFVVNRREVARSQKNWRQGLTRAAP